MPKNNKKNSDGIRLQQPRPSTRVIRLTALKKNIAEEPVLEDPPIKTFIPKPKADFFERPTVEGGSTEASGANMRPTPAILAEVQDVSAEEEPASPENIFSG